MEQKHKKSPPTLVQQHKEVPAAIQQYKEVPTSIQQHKEALPPAQQYKTVIIRPTKNMIHGVCNIVSSFFFGDRKILHFFS
jgi:hypothetical protein